MPSIHFAQVVRRDVRRHADGDTGAAVDQKIRKRRRKDAWFLAGLVVVRDEIDGPLIHVRHQRRAEMLQARLGVTHGRRRIAFQTAPKLPWPSINISRIAQGWAMWTSVG